MSYTRLSKQERFGSESQRLCIMCVVHAELENRAVPLSAKEHLYSNCKCDKDVHGNTLPGMEGLRGVIDSIFAAAKPQRSGRGKHNKRPRESPEPQPFSRPSTLRHLPPDLLIPPTHLRHPPPDMLPASAFSPGPTSLPQIAPVKVRPDPKSSVAGPSTSAQCEAKNTVDVGVFLKNVSTRTTNEILLDLVRGLSLQNVDMLGISAKADSRRSDKEKWFLRLLDVLIFQRLLYKEGAASAKEYQENRHQKRMLLFKK